MPTPFKAPPQCICTPHAIICFGGPTLEIDVGGRIMAFEMHRYFGPIPLNKKTQDPLERIPSAFWKAYEQWKAGGKLVDGARCVIPQAPEAAQ